MITRLVNYVRVRNVNKICSEILESKFYEFV